MADGGRWYPTKIDWWIGVLLALWPIISLGALVVTLVAGEGFVFALTSIPVMVAVYGGLVFPMRYGFSDRHVLVRHGLITQRIPLADIEEVRPTRSPLSSPALSLDRLRIRFGKGFFRSALISPADKDGFLRDLAARSGLVAVGDGLARR